MKKILLFGVVAMLCACNHTVKPENDSDKLVLMNNEPKGCVFLYKMDADASFYSHDDAIQYLKNRIMSQPKQGNVFLLEKDEKEQNSWVMFGPEYKYFMTARVYSCPISE